MNWSEIGILYRRELRSAFRERTIVMNSILLPIFLYPVMLWLMFTGITFVSGLQEGFVSRVALEGVPAAHGEIRDSLEAMESVELVDPVPAEDEATALIREGELDVLVQLLPASEGNGRLEGNFTVRLTFDRSDDRSRTARDRAAGVVERYRDRWLQSEARALGIPPEELDQFRIASRNVATEEEMGQFLLGQMIPLFLVIMVALGCFIPAVDSTAGERERSTWETTMTVAASRRSIIASKYLYVATLGTLAGILNVVAMTASMGPVMRPMMGEAGESLQFAIPLAAVPVMIAGALVLALFFAAAMMIVAAFARTFKDGQAMVQPIYWLVFLPIIFMGSPDRELSPEMAAVPIANVALMIRDAITGSYQPVLIAETLGVGLVLVLVCLWLARWVLQFEDFLMGSYDGSLWKFTRERLFGREEKPA